MSPRVPFPVQSNPRLRAAWDRLQSMFGASIAGGRSSVVYRPGAPSSGNAVATWAEVMAVVASVENLIVYVDTSQTPGTPAPVPSGVYNMRFAELSTVATPTGIVVLDMAADAQLQNVKFIRDGLELRCHPDAAPALTFPATSGIPQVLAVYNGALIDNQGSVPAIEVDGNGAFFVVAAVISGWIGPQSGICSQPIVHVPDGSTVLVVDQTGQWAQNWLSGTAASNLVYNALSPSFPDPPPAIPAFLGSASFAPPNNGNLDHGRRIVYTPANGADWQDPDPTTVQEAIDRIAAAVVAGAAGPIA